MEDAKIVELYWQRNENAITETSKKYNTYLLKIANNILYDTEDSRESVNDTLLAAWNSMPEQRPSVLSTYLGKIIRQISIDRYRKKNSKKRFASQYASSISEMEDCFADENTPESELDAKLIGDAVNSFIRSLPDESRRVFIGRYYFFDSVKEIASYCGISEANVKTTLFRTRQKLKEYLIGEGFEL